MESKTTGRILIIGLDGASPALVERWQDDLPNLRRLIERGVSGRLESVIPPRSIPAWYCLATGMNPAKLGVFGFSQRRPGTYDYDFANFTHCQAPPFWEWLGREGMESAIIHLPGTFPPRPLHGFMLSGWPGPLNQGNLVYSEPAALSREVDRFLGRPFEFISPKAIGRDNDAEMLAERLRILQMHGDVAHHLLSHKPWQVAVTVLAPIDRASHQFWRHMDPTHPHHDPAAAATFGDALKQVYIASDQQTGRLLNLLDANDTVFIISDHGFGPVHRTFYLNEWLHQQGYLVLQGDAAPQQVRPTTRLLGRLAAPLFRLNQASPFFRRLARPFKKRAASNFLRNQFVLAQKEGVVRLNHLPVDWARTRAYCPDESSLYLNLHGRDPQGCVQPGRESEQLLQEISAKLQALSDPHTGRSLPVRLYPKEQVYNGPFLDAAPELTVMVDDLRANVMAEMGTGRLFDDQPLWSGNHTLDGLFIAAGPGIAAGQRHDAHLLDIAPTVLHLAGVPVPQAMDGRVLQAVFDPAGEAAQRPVTFQNSGDPWTDEAEGYSEADLAHIEKQLKDLGYLG